jgi:hypothetical protein
MLVIRWVSVFEHPAKKGRENELITNRLTLLRPPQAGRAVVFELGLRREFFQTQRRRGERMSSFVVIIFAAKPTAYDIGLGL